MGRLIVVFVLAISLTPATFAQVIKARKSSVHGTVTYTLTVKNVSETDEVYAFYFLPPGVPQYDANLLYAFCFKPAHKWEEHASGNFCMRLSEGKTYTFYRMSNDSDTFPSIWIRAAYGDSPAHYKVRAQCCGDYH